MKEEPLPHLYPKSAAMLKEFAEQDRLFKEKCDEVLASKFYKAPVQTSTSPRTRDVFMKKNVTNRKKPKKVVKDE